MIDTVPLGCCKDNWRSVLSQGPACSPLTGRLYGSRSRVACCYHKPTVYHPPVADHSCQRCKCKCSQRLPKGLISKLKKTADGHNLLGTGYSLCFTMSFTAFALPSPPPAFQNLFLSSFTQDQWQWGWWQSTSQPLHLELTVPQFSHLWSLILPATVLSLPHLSWLCSVCPVVLWQRPIV